MSYLRRVISADGYTIDPKNVDAVLGKLKKPNNITELRSLLGLVGYFRRAIPNFSQIAKLLYDILKNSDLTSRSKQPINWREEHQSSLDTLLIQIVYTLTPLLSAEGGGGVEPPIKFSKWGEDGGLIGPQL